jgi:hypothetical protein
MKAAPDFRLGVCTEDECGRPVKARDRCKQHYEIWLAAAAPSDKVRRIIYPSDDALVAMFERLRRITDVAAELGISRSSLRDYIEIRPALRDRVAPVRRLPAEVVKQREKDAQRRWRMRNPERLRASNRLWARNRNAATVRRWNQHSAQRRAEQIRAVRLRPRTIEEARLHAEYEAILANDPCVYCGAPAGTVDHIQPINQAGTDEWDNYAPACSSCNSSKRDKGLLQFLLWRLKHAAPGPRPRGVPV